MDIPALTTFLMWCTILNFVLLSVSFLICVFASDWVHQLHSIWFPLPKETFNVMLYSFVSLYKFFFFFFNVIPYVALLIMGSG
jgi:hypothetical protein